METRTVFGAQVPCLPNFSLSPFQSFSFPRNLTLSSTKTTKRFHLRAASFDHEGIRRPIFELPPSQWSDHFLAASLNVSEMDALAREIDELNPKVRDMLMSSDNTKKKICFVNLLVNLGLSHHFENEIKEILEQAFKNIENMIVDEDDLYTISVMFQVFRTYGHHMSSDVFKRFTGDDGKFQQCLIRDVKGMLSLYEAANWGTTTEDILDEAMSFTVNHLESLAGGASPHISRLIKASLDLPRRRNIGILVAREHISFYEQEEDHNEMLLKFAKLNLKFLRLLYVQELKTVTKWWADLDFGSKLPPYFRDKIVECYFYAMGYYLEPQFSNGRIIMAKINALLTIFDDTCDRYASLPEVIRLVDSVERWDPDATDKLPDCLNIVFRFIFDLFQELEEEVRSEGRSYSVQGTLEEFKQLARVQVVFAKWAQAVYMPTFEEYMEVGSVDITAYVVLAGIFIGMGHIAGKEFYEWFKSKPKLIEALGRKGRLHNDLAGFEEDMHRGYAITGVNVYMKQYGVTEEEALRELRKMSRDINKIINEELLKTTAVPWRILQNVINFESCVDVAYAYGEGFTLSPEKIVGYITSLFLDPIRV